MSGRDAASIAATRALLGFVAALTALACLQAPPTAQAEPRDSNCDGLSNSLEGKRSLTNLRRANIDRDGLTDRFELQTSRTSPRKKDTDGDGLSDRVELRFGTNPLLFDTDGDDTGDGVEVLLGREPLKPDPPAPPKPPPPPPPPPPDTTAPETAIAAGPTGTVASASSPPPPRLGRPRASRRPSRGRWWGWDTSFDSPTASARLTGVLGARTSGGSPPRRSAPRRSLTGSCASAVTGARVTRTRR
jgi:hypothetical protein